MNFTHLETVTLKSKITYIIKDKTTPDAVIIAQQTSIGRLHANGTREHLVGDKDKQG